jgi:hypothetical protein
MISVRQKKSIFTTSTVWFANTPALGRILSLATYRQCRSAGRYPSFLKRPFHTIYIDLKQNEDAILSAFKKSTRYDVRRAEQEAIECGVVEAKASFVDFYNVFADSKGRPRIRIGELDAFGKSISITEARGRSERLVMHSYILDREGARARLLHSASDFRNMTTADQRNEVGRANRLLHYVDMLTFKEMGFEVYDFGGYSISDLDDEKRRINDFKAGFGGTIVEETDAVSLGVYLINKLRGSLASLRSLVDHGSMRPAGSRG